MSRLIKLIPKLMPLHYDPDLKGVYFHKKEMLDFIKKIEINNVMQNNTN